MYLVKMIDPDLANLEVHSLSNTPCKNLQNISWKETFKNCNVHKNLWFQSINVNKYLLNLYKLDTENTIHKEFELNLSNSLIFMNSWASCKGES